MQRNWTNRLWSWHFHHCRLMEPLREGQRSYLERQRNIKKDKPKHEIKTRLRLFKIVKGRIPLAVRRARDIPERYRSAVNRLHRKECPNCPWDGWTIFPDG